MFALYAKINLFFNELSQSITPSICCCSIPLLMILFVLEHFAAHMSMSFRSQSDQNLAQGLTLTLTLSWKAMSFNSWLMKRLDKVLFWTKPSIYSKRGTKLLLDFF